MLHVQESRYPTRATSIRLHPSTHPLHPGGRLCTAYADPTQNLCRAERHHAALTPPARTTSRPRIGEDLTHAGGPLPQRGGSRPVDVMSTAPLDPPPPAFAVSLGSQPTETLLLCYAKLRFCHSSRPFSVRSAVPADSPAGVWTGRTAWARSQALASANPPPRPDSARLVTQGATCVTCDPQLLRSCGWRLNGCQPTGTRLFRTAVDANTHNSEGVTHEQARQARRDLRPRHR